MLLKRDEVAILQTGKNKSSVLFLNEHEEGRAQVVELIYPGYWCVWRKSSQYFIKKLGNIDTTLSREQ